MTRRRLLMIPAGLLVIACGSPAETADVAPFSSQEYVVLTSDLPHDVPHVLSWAAHEPVPRIDGIEVRAGGERRRATRFSWRDAAGRQVRAQASALGTEEGAITGVIERCGESSCERGTLSLMPLSSLYHDPGRLELVGSYDGEDWQSGMTVHLAASDSIVVLARGDDGVRIVDFSDAQHPRELSHVDGGDVDEWINDVAIYQSRWLLLASSTRGLRVLDIQQPEAPAITVDGFPLGVRAVHNLALRGDYVYLARTGGAGGVTLVDLAEPASPRVVMEFESEHCRQVHGVDVHGDRMMLSCLDQGFNYYDVSRLDDPRHLVVYPSSQAHSARPLPELGQTWLVTSEAAGASVELLAYVHGELDSVGEFTLGTGASPHDALCAGSRCWVSYYQEGVVELDVSDPTSPARLTQYATWHGPGRSFFEGASGVALSDAHLVVADTEQGAMLFRR